MRHRLVHLALRAHVAFHERGVDLARGGLTGLLLYVEDHGASAACHDPLGHGPSQSGGAAGDDGRDILDPHFRLMVVLTPPETVASSNQREVMVLVCV